jgi:2-polyprenyl-6-methoxyphenol hydroxylase-like FAD-dependent oxidoreductase
MRIGIVGCGTAGPAAALFLARAGHEVELFERAPVLHPLGAGFVLQPTGLSVLEHLGLAAAVEERGARIEGLHARTFGGRALLALDYASLQSDLYALGLQRAALQEVLVAAMRDAGVSLRCGIEMRGAERSRGGFILRDTKEAPHGPFAWIVVADGARSALREATGLPISVRPYPWGATWAVLPDPERRIRGALVQCVDGTRHMAGLLPSGRIGAEPGEPPAASLFLSTRLDRAPRGTREDLGRVREETARLLPEAASLAETLSDPSQLSVASYLDVRMPRAILPGIVVLGDAAHAMSPQLGQGVNLALCDAEAFTESLRDSSTDDEVVARYTRARRTHLRFYQQATRWLTPFFQSDVRALGLLRDLVFPAVGLVPPLRRQMLRAMAGVKRGWLRRSLALPPVRSGRRPSA